jgi:uncharacterized protein YhdP
VFSLFFSSGFILSYILKERTPWIENQIAQEIGREVSLKEASVYWSWRGPGIQLKDFSLLNDGVFFNHIYLSVSFWESLLQRDLKLTYIELEGFQVTIGSNPKQQEEVEAQNFSTAKVVRALKKVKTQVRMRSGTLRLIRPKKNIIIQNLALDVEPDENELEVNFRFNLAGEMFQGEFEILEDEPGVLTSSQFMVESPLFQIQSYFSIPIENEIDKRGQIYFHFRQTQLGKILKIARLYFPDNFPVEKVAQIVQDGKVDRGFINLIKPEQSMDYSLKSELLVEKVKIKFAPDWPQIDDIKAHIFWDGPNATAEVSQGISSGIKIKRAQLVAKNLYDEKASLLIKPLLHIQENQASTYLQNSPLWSRLSFVGGMAYMRGDFELQLGIMVPLYHSIDTTAVGTLLFKENSQISFYNTNYALKNLKGGISFNEQGILNSSMRGSFFADEFHFHYSDDIYTLKSYRLDMKYDQKGIDKFTLNKAVLPKIEFIGKMDELKEVTEPDFKEISLEIKNLVYDTLQFSDIRARRAGLDNGYEFYIETSKGSLLDFQKCRYRWLKDEKSMSTLNCLVNIQDIGTLFKYFNISDSMEGGKGKAIVSSSWEGGLDKYSMYKTPSRLEVETDEFKLKGEKSKTRNFLNFLTFNLFGNEKEKIKVNKTSGELIIKDNEVSTQKFVIQMPALDLDTEGKISMQTKQVDLDVTLNINIAGLISTYGAATAVLTSATASPIILAAFIPGLRELSKKTVGKLFSQVYSVSGTIEAPKAKVKKFANIPIPGFKK